MKQSNPITVFAYIQLARYDSNHIMNLPENNSIVVPFTVVSSKVNLYQKIPFKEKPIKTSNQRKQYQSIRKSNIKRKIAVSNTPENTSSPQRNTTPNILKANSKSLVKINHKVDCHNPNYHLKNSNAKVSPRATSPKIKVRSIVNCHNDQSTFNIGKDVKIKLTNKIPVGNGNISARVECHNRKPTSISKGVKIEFTKKIAIRNVSPRVDCHNVDYQAPKAEVKLSPRRKKIDLSKVKGLVECHNKTTNSSIESKAKITEKATKIDLKNISCKIDNYSDNKSKLSPRKVQVVCKKTDYYQVQGRVINYQDANYKYPANGIEIWNQSPTKIEAHSRIPIGYSDSKKEHRDNIAIFQNSMDLNEVAAKVDHFNHHFNSTFGKEKPIVYHNVDDINLDDVNPIVDCRQRSVTNKAKTTAVVYDSPSNISNSNVSKIDHQNGTYHPQDSYAHIRQDTIQYNTDAVVDSINKSYCKNKRNSIGIVNSSVNFNDIGSKIDHINLNSIQNNDDLAKIKSNSVSYKDIPARVSNVNTDYHLPYSNVDICNSKSENYEVASKIDSYNLIKSSLSNSLIVSDILNYSKIPSKVDHGDNKYRKQEVKAEVIQVGKSQRHFAKEKSNRRKLRYNSLKYTSSLGGHDDLSQDDSKPGPAVAKRGQDSISFTGNGNRTEILTSPASCNYDMVKSKIDCYNFMARDNYPKQYNNSHYATAVEVL